MINFPLFSPQRLFEATLPKFPVEILWVSIIPMRNTGAPCFIHPFPTSFDGDAILLYSILFPPGISPHLALQLGDGFHKFILAYLLSVLPAQQADINKFVSNLFCLMSPSITKHMGAGRLCILATDEPSPEILHYMRQLSFRIPAWTGNPALTGSIPTAETTIDTGGHLPSPTTMRNPDYLQPTLATYFFTGNQAYQVIVDHLKLSLSSLFPKSTPPAWISHLSYSTPHGTIHVIISQLPPGFTPSPARARGDMIPITSDLRIPCIQVLLRPDIAYFYHLPIASVGGFYTHMPLGDCTSPSAALLSHYLGRPPLEALYLLTIHDCASVAANMLNDPLIPLLPSPSAQPIPTAALDDTQPTPKRRGRPSLFRPTPAPLDPAASYKSRPTALLLSPPTSTPSSNSSQAVSVETITRIEAQLATAFARIHSLEQLVHTLSSNQPPTDPISSPMANIGINYLIIHSINFLQVSNPLRRNSPLAPSAKLRLVAQPKSKETLTWIKLKKCFQRRSNNVQRTPFRNLRNQISFQQINTIFKISNCLYIKILQLKYVNQPQHSTSTKLILWHHVQTPPHTHLTYCLPPTTKIPFPTSPTNPPINHGTPSLNTHTPNTPSHPTCQSIIIKFNTTTMVSSPPTNPHTPLSFLITQFQNKYHPIPHNYTISYAHRTICPSTPIAFFNDIPTPIFTINLPILGGAKQLNS